MMSLPDFGCMLSVGAISFEDRFCAGKKGGIGGGGQTHAVMTCRALVGTGWTISHSVKHKWV